MKKYLVIMMFAIAAFGFIGCSSDDNTKADIRWNNDSSESIYDIKWVSGGQNDQTWSETLTDNNSSSDYSSYKGINELTGQGECLDVVDQGTGTEGKPYDIYIDGALNYTVTENATETLHIDQIQAK